MADGERSAPGVARRDVAALVRSLTLDEKAALTAGADLWSLPGVERVGIPPVRLTDGPNGARGPALPGIGDEPLPSTCVPVATALGATWDVELVERVGAVVGSDARAKGCRVLLAPTVNLHRSPLGGRNFEAYSEDPLLSGRLAAAFVRGAQSCGVVTTVKHFVANESELERMTVDVRVGDRALRELYLRPFELAVREGGALGIMTSYNRVNGRYVADAAALLAGVLRGEWGFEGFVVTDWYALADTTAAIHAGLDLEMPGPGRAYGDALAAAVHRGEVDEALVDAAVGRLLDVLDRVGALDDPPEHEPVTNDRPEHRATAREAAAAATVLLVNDGLLPLDPPTLGTLAVIGPNAGRAVIMGGGSSQLTPHHLTSPLDALRARLGPATPIVHEPGVDIDRTTPPVPGEWLLAPSGERGFDVAIADGTDPSARVAHTTVRHDGALWFFGPPSAEVGPCFAARATARLTVPESGRYVVALSQAGAEARVLFDGETVLDGTGRRLPPGPELLGTASTELTVTLDLDATRPVEAVVELVNATGAALSGAKLGCRPAPTPDRLDRAVAAAAAADAVVLVVGTDSEWEGEGHDRASMHLPGGQDDLVEAVLAANPDTVVVVNAGTVVAMPWAERARAVVQCWFGGQEMADGLVDVLLGDVDPGGRLPTTVPRRVEHTAAFGNFPAERGVLSYGEGVLVGYRWFDARHLPVAFAFGHGLSYTSFDLGEPNVGHDGDTVVVEVPVTNTGVRVGSEVVQCYVAPPRTDHAVVVRPPQELRAFAKVTLQPGETATVRLGLDRRAFAYWDPGDPDAAALAERLAATTPWARPPAGRGVTPGWVVDAGRHELRIGRSSRDIAHVVGVDVAAGRVT